jgi:glycosyltransferase involved in cell wall biosynthesis
MSQSSYDITKDTAVVIPYFNELSSIGKVLDELKNHLVNIVIVDDGSAEALKIPYCNVVVIRHKVNLGQGAAIQTGFEYALKKGAKYLVTFDADGQHDPADLPLLINNIKIEGYDVVLGSRFLSTEQEGMPAGRKRLLKFSRYVNYLFTGLFLSDAHNGLRAFSDEAARTVKLTENRMAHATEILSIIKKNKLRFREVPVSVRYTQYSKMKGQSSLNSIRIFFDLVLHKLFE